MLYECLTRYGDCYSLKQQLNTKITLNHLENYKDKWVKYNPRKDLPRYGLSITSLDGGISGIPDLDSIHEYNIKNNLKLDETDFNTITELWPIVESALLPYKNYLGRTHFIKMDRGGCFPPHRDNHTIKLNSFRLFLPISNCNPPNNYFVLDDKILHFDHGRLYFLDTCKEHTVFTTNQSSVFVVANIILNEQSVETVLKNIYVW